MESLNSYTIYNHKIKVNRKEYSCFGRVSEDHLQCCESFDLFSYFGLLFIKMAIIILENWSILRELCSYINNYDIFSKREILCNHVFLLKKIKNRVVLYSWKIIASFCPCLKTYNPLWIIHQSIPFSAFLTSLTFMFVVVEVIEHLILFLFFLANNLCVLFN